MGNPDGGWYDETPPHVVGAEPADQGTNVKQRKIRISFNEFVKIDNATEKVIVSPPQLQMPEIKATGKTIEVKLLDSLQRNTTYTVVIADGIAEINGVGGVALERVQQLHLNRFTRGFDFGHL